MKQDTLYLLIGVGILYLWSQSASNFNPFVFNPSPNCRYPDGTLLPVPPGMPCPFRIEYGGAGER